MLQCFCHCFCFCMKYREDIAYKVGWSCGCHEANWPHRTQHATCRVWINFSCRIGCNTVSVWLNFLSDTEQECGTVLSWSAVKKFEGVFFALSTYFVVQTRNVKTVFLTKPVVVLWTPVFYRLSDDVMNHMTVTVSSRKAEVSVKWTRRV